MGRDTLGIGPLCVCAGVKLKARQVLQLAEAGAVGWEDLASKVVDLVEHGALNVHQHKTRTLVRG